MPFYPISTLHAWNCRLVPVFGFPLNALLFWLVWTKTPKEMRLHSRILLQTCCVDFTFLGVILIATPVVVYEGTILVLLLDGYLMRPIASIFHNDPLFYILLNFLINMCYFFDIFSISVQFVYRYMLLNRNNRINFCRYLLMLTLAFIASVIVTISYNFFVEYEEVDAELKASLKAYIDWDNSIYVLTTSKADITYALAIFGTILSYSINLFCGIKVVKFVAAHGIFNPRMKELNKQLTKNLMILAFFPLFNFLPTLLIGALSVVLRITGSELLAKVILFVGYFFTSLCVWLPVVNPTVSIWINRPYRDAVNKFMASIFRKDNSVTTIQPLNQ